MFRMFLVTALVAALPAAARGDSVLYDGALGSTPAAQGWLYLSNPLAGALATQSASNGFTTLDTTPRASDSAGYFSAGQASVGVLDRAVGYTIDLRLRVLQETHLNTNRAGFSLLVLGNDAWGVELGFWADEIWAQNPGFTHGEGVLFDTTGAVTDYALTAFGSSYALTANGNTVLSGALRDYSAFGAPYNTTHLVFMGDNTSSAAAGVQIARVGVTQGATLPEPASALLVALGLGLLRLGRRRAPR